MATVFICYASEDRDTAESIQLALRSAGHRVFFDKDSLPSAGDYHAQIQKAIDRCDVFVFLASAAALGTGSYALTELRFARERWPDPVNRVLPVAIGRLAPEALPAYLRAVTLLGVEGNPAAEVRGAIASLLRARAAKRTRLLVLAASFLGLVAGGFYLFLERGAHANAAPPPILHSLYDGTWTASGSPGGCYRGRAIVSVFVTLSVRFDVAQSGQIDVNASGPCSQQATQSSAPAGDIHDSYRYTGRSGFPPFFDREYLFYPVTPDSPVKTVFLWTGESPANGALPILVSGFSQGYWTLQLLKGKEQAN